MFFILSMPRKALQAFWSKLSAFGSSPPREEVFISEPNSFRHEGHISCTSGAKYEVRNIPAEWKHLFAATVPASPRRKIPADVPLLTLCHVPADSPWVSGE